MNPLQVGIHDDSEEVLLVGQCSWRPLGNRPLALPQASKLWALQRRKRPLQLRITLRNKLTDALNGNKIAWPQFRVDG